jgi:integrase
MRQSSILVRFNPLQSVLFLRVFLRAAVRRVRVSVGLKPGKPLSNMAMLGLLKDVNRDKSGEPRWIDPDSGRAITPHGLRATFRTWGENAGFPRDLLEESLGHQIGTAVERAYRGTDSFERRREIMETRVSRFSTCETKLTA